jgi:hypothetical protein
LSPAPFDSGQPLGFLKGYLIGCGVLCGLVVAQFVVLVLLS